MLSIQSRLQHKLTYVTLPSPAFLSAFSTTIAPINPAVRPYSPAGRCGGRIPISSRLSYSLAVIPPPNYHGMRQRGGVAPLSLRTFSYRSAALVCGTRQLVTATAECNDSDCCSEMRLHEEQGPCRSTLSISVPWIRQFASHAQIAMREPPIVQYIDRYIAVLRPLLLRAYTLEP